MAYQLLCEGAVTLTVEGAPVCSGGWVLSPAMETFVVDQAAIAACGIAFTAGFSVVLTVWLLSLGFRFVLSLLR